MTIFFCFVLFHFRVCSVYLFTIHSNLAMFILIDSTLNAFIWQNMLKVHTTFKPYVDVTATAYTFENCNRKINENLEKTTT